MNLQSSLRNNEVIRNDILDSTGTGIAILAGMTSGLNSFGWGTKTLERSGKIFNHGKDD